MKNIFGLISASIGSVALTLCIALLGQSASASGDQLGALDANASLLTKSTLVQGEPIILRYSVSNTSDQKLGLNWEGAEGYSLALTDQTGATTPLEQKQSPKAGFHPVLDPFMPSGGKYEVLFAVPEQTMKLQPGKYTLTVRVRLPYTTADASEENPLVIEKEIKVSGNVFSRVFSFPLTVTAPNDGVLRARAASLLKAISTLPYGPEYIAGTDALFYMPEAQAAASWQALATHPNAMNASLIADRLGNVGSVKASDLLLKMLDNPALSTDNSIFVSRKLAEVYNSGGSDVRSHLKNTMMQRGVNLPNEVPVSQPTD